MLTLEQRLQHAAFAAHAASGDSTLAVIFAARVLTRLRQVAPELVEAAEVEVAFGDA